MRICVVIPQSGGDDDEDDGRRFDMTSYFHVECFRIPKKYTTGPTKRTPTEFVQDCMTDASTDGTILPSQLDVIVQRMTGGDDAGITGSASGQKVQHHGSAKKKKSSKSEMAEHRPDDALNLMGRLAMTYRKRQNDDDDDDDDERPKKKSKKDGKTIQEEDDDDFEDLLESYTKHVKSKVDDLKEILRYVSV